MITFPRVVRAEWTKLVSLRSTWVTLGTSAVLAVGIAGAIGYGVRHAVEGGDPPPALPEVVGAAFLPIDFFVLVFGVFGVLQMTGEYGSGLIRATLTAVPRRWPVTAAKAVVQVAVTLPVMAVTALGSFLACQAFLGEHGASLGDAGVPRAIVGATLAPVLVGLLGLGVGTAVRHTAGAITTLVAALFVIPVLLGPVLPGEMEKDVMKYVPTVAGQAMYSIDGGGQPFETLAPGASAAVMVGWSALLLAGGVALLLRRDA
ncbi:ABC transporter permease subunit [Phytohabitans houttuyneae]|uniref:ABC transporter permease n=1 Tax=Phytohabitans houttuyneae TaxID=1076126 RepID=A0A6V8K8I2_9ACTN|nr:ABC transporter permease subunit [Phytohabitans houttuyneae]GFJ78598.1 ABC transporter permease [Phytohabitans houttuyneae]